MKKIEQNISLFNTYINLSAFKKVRSVLDSTFLSEGAMVKKFENQLSQKLGLLNPVTVNSGTSALHLALILAGIRPGDEVILPSQTFVATGLAVLYVGAKPVFADIQYETGNIDPRDIEKKITRKTKAILPVHWNGYPCDMDEIKRITKKYDLVVIEDAARALGSTYKNRPIGSISDITCFSFQAIKHLTTGDGGAVCFKSKMTAGEARVMRWFGIDRAKSKPSILGERDFKISKLGYKYHLNDYEAALGLANLEGFKKRLARRQQIANFYKKNLTKIGGITLFEEKPDRKSAYFLFGFHVEKRLDFIQAMKSRGVPVTVDTLGIARHPIFSKFRASLPNNSHFNKTQINIPCHDGLSRKGFEHIVESIKKGW